MKKLITTAVVILVAATILSVGVYAAIQNTRNLDSNSTVKFTSDESYVSLTAKIEKHYTAGLYTDADKGTNADGESVGVDGIVGVASITRQTYDLDNKGKTRSFDMEDWTVNDIRLTNLVIPADKQAATGVSGSTKKYENEYPAIVWTFEFKNDGEHDVVFTMTNPEAPKLRAGDTSETILSRTMTAQTNSTDTAAATKFATAAAYTNFETIVVTPGATLTFIYTLKLVDFRYDFELAEGRLSVDFDVTMQRANEKQS